MPGTISGTGYTAVNKIDKSPCPLGAYNLVWGDGAGTNKYIVRQTMISALDRNGAG